MATVNKETLKTYFNTGDTPTEAQFADLIDSMAHENHTHNQFVILTNVKQMIIGQGVLVDGNTDFTHEGITTNSFVFVTPTPIGTLNGQIKPSTGEGFVIFTSTDANDSAVFNFVIFL
jgi:hypothetical protein